MDKIKKIQSVVIRLSSAIYGIYRVGGYKMAVRYFCTIIASLQKIIKTSSLRSVDQCFEGESGHINIKIEGEYNVLLPASAFGLAREIWAQRIYFLGQPKIDIREIRTAVDLGANCGVFTIGVAGRGSRVLAVEVQDIMIENLKHNLNAAGLSANVTIINGYVGALKDPVDDNLSTVANIEMDSILSKPEWSVVDFMKVDIEGSEFELFKGSPSWMNRVKRISMEVHPEAGNVFELVKDLKRTGFTVQLRDKAFRPVEKIVEEVGFCYAWK